MVAPRRGHRVSRPPPQQQRLQLSQLSIADIADSPAAMATEGTVAVVAAAATAPDPAKIWDTEQPSSMKAI